MSQWHGANRERISQLQSPNSQAPPSLLMLSQRHRGLNCLHPSIVTQCIFIVLLPESLLHARHQSPAINKTDTVPAFMSSHATWGRWTVNANS